MESTIARPRYAPPETAGDLARRTTLGVLVAVVAVLLARGIALGIGADVGANGVRSPFDPVPLVAASVVAGAGAAVVYAALDRLTDRPVRNFLALAGLVFAGMLVPVFAFAPSLGVTPVGQAVLVALHVAVAVPLVALVVGAVRP